MKFGLIEDTPPAGTTAALLERRVEAAAKDSRRQRVARYRARAGVELAVHDLCHEMAGNLKQVKSRDGEWVWTRRSHNGTRR